MKHTKKIVFSALFAGIIFVATFVFIVPLPYGYFNCGDIFVLLSGWLLGPLYGGLASGIGSCLADVISGFALYAPVTFIVKFLVSLSAWFMQSILKKLIKNKKFDFFCRIISAIISEMIMVIGYFIYESFLYGLTGGVLSIVGNLMQALIGAVAGAFLVSALYVIKPLKKIFPLLHNE